MTNTNCLNCDKPECEREALFNNLVHAVDDLGGITIDRDAYSILQRRHGLACAACEANAVDWRTVALTEKARADAAEARIAEVEAVAKRLADFFDRQPSDYRLGLRHGAQRAVEGLASQIGEPKP